MTDARLDDPQVSEREIAFTRVLRAPREQVWKIWTDPKHLAQWWGPTGFTTITHDMDVRPGGRWRFVMRGPDGRDYENLVNYVKVDPPSLLVYRHGGEVELEPVNFEVTVRFVSEDDGRSTRLHMNMVFPSAKAKDHVVNKYGAIEGGKQTLARLAEHLATLDGAGSADDAPFVIRRVVRAPRELVWRAWTERDHMAKWFGPKGSTILKGEYDPRPGGVYHYLMRSAEGLEMWGKWVFREVEPQRRLVFVSSFSDADGNAARAPFSPTWPMLMLSTVTLDDHAGIGRGTVVTVEWSPLDATPEELATFSAARPSMNTGWSGTFDQLESYLASL